MEREYHFYVYMMASESGTLYTGMTNSLYVRTGQHKRGENDGFSKKYKCHKLVYYEHFYDVYEAIQREKQIKRWRREKKESLIRKMNPLWLDLSDQVTEL